MYDDGKIIVTIDDNICVWSKYTLILSRRSGECCKLMNSSEISTLDVLRMLLITID